MAEPQDRHHRPARRCRRPGGGLVHWPVLRLVLSREDAEGRRRDGQYPDRDRARAGDAVLRAVRLAVGQNRTQADHPRRLRARRAHLFPFVRGAHPGRQPRAPPRADIGAGVGDRASRTSARSSSIRSARTASTRARATSPRPISPRRRSLMPISRLRRGRSPASGSATRISQASIPARWQGLRGRPRSPRSRSGPRRRWPLSAIPPKPTPRRSTSRWWWRSCSCSCST